MARKPLIGTVAGNVAAHATGAINIDACRVAAADSDYAHPGSDGIADRRNVFEAYAHGNQSPPSDLGRWPANVVHDGSDEVVAGFPSSVGGGAVKSRRNSAPIWGRSGHQDFEGYDSGLAARFFYCAKASKADRDEGLGGFTPQAFVQFQTANGTSGKASSLSEGRETEYRNIHPTVKPTALMRYLCRLVTPPGGLVLDPFAGSGSTGKASILEGFRFVGCELTDEYVPIAEARIARAVADRDAAVEQGSLFTERAA